MRSLGWVLIQHDWRPYKKGKFGGRLARQETPCEDESEMGVVRLQTKGPQETTRGWGRGPEQVLPQSPGGAPVIPGPRTSGLQDWETLEPPHLTLPGAEERETPRSPRVGGGSAWRPCPGMLRGSGGPQGAVGPDAAPSMVTPGLPSGSSSPILPSGPRPPPLSSSSSCSATLLSPALSLSPDPRASSLPSSLCSPTDPICVCVCVCARSSHIFKQKRPGPALLTPPSKASERHPWGPSVQV